MHVPTQECDRTIFKKNVVDVYVFSTYPDEMILIPSNRALIDNIQLLFKKFFHAISNFAN